MIRMVRNRLDKLNLKVKNLFRNGHNEWLRSERE